MKTLPAGDPSLRPPPQALDSAVDLNALWAAIERDGPLRSFAADFRSSSADGIWPERGSAQMDRRRRFVAFYSWAVPDRAAITAIARFVARRRLLEVGAGRGLWARLLAETGRLVLATDLQPHPAGGYYPVQPEDAEAAVHAHPECSALLLCWPSFRSPWAVRALRAFGGDRVIVIGDARFTADAEFHAELAHQWVLQERLPLPSWPAFQDSVALYRRPSARSGAPGTRSS